MLFARVAGRLDWACPACNSYQLTYLRRTSCMIECKECKRKWYYGTVLYEVPGGPRRVPMDTLMLGGGFSIRRLVNRVYCALCEREIIAQVKTQMFEDTKMQPHPSKDGL